MALRTAALALAAALVLLSACSGEDEPGSTPDPDVPTTSEPSTSEPVSAPVSEAAEAEAAVAGFYDDFAAGDLDAACAWWTGAYAASSVEGWNEGDYGPAVDSCPDLLREITEVLAIVGDPAAQLEVTAVHGELVDATSARVDVTLAAAEQPETYLLTRTANGWRISGDEAGDLAPDES